MHVWGDAGWCAVGVLVGVRCWFVCCRFACRCACCRLVHRFACHRYARRFAREADHGAWADRLHVLGADFRDLKALEAMCAAAERQLREERELTARLREVASTHGL